MLAGLIFETFVFSFPKRIVLFGARLVILLQLSPQKFFLKFEVGVLQTRTMQKTYTY